mmetsp:Transcript_50243/g.145995  ORF Transcript_50243/g.145995 Transcript_50243/m.145995 type:complete len:291 (-) Transcript_50243:12-884(-)
MYRAIPVASKTCAERAQARHHEIHKQRVKAVKPVVDTSEPHVVHMDHIRMNLKREQIMEDRYAEIDRDNRLLLHRMSEMMKQNTHTPKPRPGPKSMTRDARKQELQRITRDNKFILERIQQVQPMYSRVEAENDYQRSFTHLKNACEYPLVLRRGPSRPGSSLTNVGSGPMSTNLSRASLGAGEAGANEDELRYVFRQGKRLGQKQYLIEMATDGRTLAVTAHDPDRNKCFELVVNEKNHRKLFRQANGDYSQIAQKLSIKGDKLDIDLTGGPLDARAGGGSTAAMAATA